MFTRIAAPRIMALILIILYNTANQWQENSPLSLFTAHITVTCEFRWRMSRMSRYDTDVLVLLLLSGIYGK